MKFLKLIIRPEVGMLLLILAVGIKIFYFMPRPDQKVQNNNVSSPVNVEKKTNDP